MRLGGLGITNPTLLLTHEYLSSTKIAAPLKGLILQQCFEYPLECIEAQPTAKKEVHKQNRERTKATAATHRATVNIATQRAIDLAQKKGASSWLMALPLEEFGFTLHKGAFIDAIAIWYGWKPLNAPATCTCGANFSLEHVLSCQKGGFPALRHNEIQDLTANLLSEVCHDVSIEPSLQPITGETLTSSSAITEDGARLDVVASGFWGGQYERAFFDIRVLTHMLSLKQATSCYLLQKAQEHQRTCLQTEGP